MFVLNLLVVAHTVFVIGTQMSRTDLNVLNSIKKAYHMKIYFKILCLHINLRQSFFSFFLYLIINELAKPPLYVIIVILQDRKT